MILFIGKVLQSWDLFFSAKYKKMIVCVLGGKDAQKLEVETPKNMTYSISGFTAFLWTLFN